MRVKAAMLIALFVLVMVSCTVGMGGSTSISEGACAAPLYGIITDEHYKMIGVEHGSDAERAGLQAGDVLLDATWVEMAPFVPCHDTFYIGPDGSPILPELVGEVSTPVEPEHPNGPVPFSNQSAITALLQLDATLKFRVQRGDQIVEMVITPGYFSFDTSKGTPTPMVGNFHYF